MTDTHEITREMAKLRFMRDAKEISQKEYRHAKDLVMSERSRDFRVLIWAVILALLNIAAVAVIGLAAIGVI